MAGEQARHPDVTVVVPGRTDVARVVTASGPLAARHDQPVGVAGEGGMVRAVLVEAGTWVRQGQVLATVDRSVQAQNIAQLAAQVQVALADRFLILGPLVSLVGGSGGSFGTITLRATTTMRVETVATTGS